MIARSLAMTLALAGCDGGQASSTLDAPAAGSSFVCMPFRVWDGDTLGCVGGPTVRLAGIGAREVKWDGVSMRDAGCASRHPCPATSGIDARNELVRLLGGPQGLATTGHVLVEPPPLSCVSTGSAGGKRVGAWCRSPATGDLSCGMVKGGYALRWEQYWRGRGCD